MDEPARLDVNVVTAMVQRDPIVIARLLQIVNSAYYGLQRKVESAERAVVLLGPVAVTGIVMGMNMLKLRSALQGPAAQTFVHLIRHSLATAFMARHLVEGAPRGNLKNYGRPRNGRLGAGFTAGLLHDFGKIILAYNRPEQAAALYSKQKLETQLMAEDPRVMERLTLGYDHTQAGEFVAVKLGFPDTLTRVIRYHHEYEREDLSDLDEETKRLLRIVAASNLIVKSMGFDVGDPVSWNEVAEDPLWEEIFSLHLIRQPSLETLQAELVEVRPHMETYVNNLASATMPTEPVVVPQNRQHFHRVRY